MNKKMFGLVLRKKIPHHLQMSKLRSLLISVVLMTALLTNLLGKVSKNGVKMLDFQKGMDMTISNQHLNRTILPTLTRL